MSIFCPAIFLMKNIMFMSKGDKKRSKMDEQECFIPKGEKNGSQ
jgi:hypothetical protein